MKQIYLKFSMLLLCLVVGLSSWATNYKLVTSADGLVAGKNYIIADATSGDVKVISTESNDNNRRTVTGTSSSGIIEATEAMMVFTLGGEAGAWTFTTTNYSGTNGNLYSNSTSSNRLFVGSNEDTDKFTIAFSNNAISSIKCNGNTTRGVMCFNGTVVACYASKSTTYKVPQLYVEDATAVINKYTVTFNAGEGSCSTTSITETRGGIGVTLPTCNPPSEDYEFVGWATSADATSANAGAVGSTYHPQKDCTLYAVYKQYYTITILAPENGTLSVKTGEKEVQSGDKYISKTNISITATPAAGFLFRNIVVNDGADHLFTANPKTWTMGEKSITISATFSEPKDINVTWSVDGSTTKTLCSEGSDISFVNPTTVPEGYVFMGWTTEEIPEKQATAPSYVKSAKATEDITYYAVFAKQSGSDVMTLAKVESESLAAGTYAIISYDEAYYLPNTAATSSCPSTKAVVKGSDGIIIVADDMKWTVSKDETSGYEFTSCDDTKLKLWGGSANDGTRVTEKSGKANATTIWYVKSTTDYGYVLYNNASEGGRYLATYGTSDWRNYTSSSSTNRAANIYKIEGGYSYSDYCTLTTEPSFTLATLSLVAHNEDGYYATFSNDKVTFFPEDADVQCVCVDGGELVTISLDKTDAVIVSDNDIFNGYFVPASTGVLVYSTDPSVTYYTVDNKAVEALDENVNLLCPASAAMTGDYKFYKLAYDDYTYKTGLGFYYGAENGGAFTCKAGTAYLAVPTSQAVKSFTLSGAATDIKNVETATKSVIYNLNGQRLNKMQKGINIVDGKKYFVK